MERALTQREEDALKHKELLDQTEVRATSAQQELDALKAKCDSWLAELTRINNEMDSNFLYPFFSFPLLLPTLEICRYMT